MAHVCAHFRAKRSKWAHKFSQCVFNALRFTRGIKLVSLIHFRQFSHTVNCFLLIIFGSISYKAVMCHGGLLYNFSLISVRRSNLHFWMRTLNSKEAVKGGAVVSSAIINSALVTIVPVFPLGTPLIIPHKTHSALKFGTSNTGTCTLAFAFRKHNEI